MANSKQAAKRNRQNERQRIRNKMIKSEVRTNIKNYLDLIEGKDALTAETQLKATVSLIDSATRKGIYHKNTSARTKSRLQKKLNLLSAE